MGKLSEDEKLQKIFSLSVEELIQIKQYIELIKQKGFSKQYQANNYITSNGLWDQFSNIRSINTHDGNRIPEIAPKFYKTVSNIAKIYGGDGTPVTKVERY